MTAEQRLLDVIDHRIAAEVGTNALPVIYTRAANSVLAALREAIADDPTLVGALHEPGPTSQHVIDMIKLGRAFEEWTRETTGDNGYFTSLFHVRTVATIYAVAGVERP